MTDRSTRNGLRWWHWWPVLLVPLDMAVVFFIRETPFGLSLRFLDATIIPMTLAGLAAVAAAVVALIRRNPLMWLMATLGLLFFLREAHPPGDPTAHLPLIKNGVYVGAALVGVWAFFWRERLQGPLGDGVVFAWLIATGWTYIASQMIARGAFPFISEVSIPNPNDPAGPWRLRTPLEETCETLAHLMLLMLALIVMCRPQCTVEESGSKGEAADGD